MNGDALWIAVSFAAGIVLGVIYFGGLWLTVRDVSRVKHPALLLFCSFLARLAVVLPAFYLVMDGDWGRMISCLAGFLALRFFLIHRIRPLGAAVKAGERMSQ